MDIALLGASVCIPIFCLGRWVVVSKPTWPMATAAGFSLGLMSLSLLEATPTGWCLVLSRYEEAPSGPYSYQSHALEVASIYWLLLWMLGLFVLVVLPATVGSGMAQALFGGIDIDDRKNKTTTRHLWRRNCPMWVQFSCGLGQIVVGYMVHWVFQWRNGSNGTARAGVVSEDEGAILVRTTSTDDSHSATTSTATPVLSRIQAYWNPLALAGAFVGVLLTLLFCSLLGSHVVVVADQSLLPTLVSWMCAIGLILSAILNGFGSVSMPYTCLAGLFLPPIRPEVLARVEAELLQVRETQAKKKRAIQDLIPRVGGPKKATTVAKKTSTFVEMGEEVEKRRQVLQTEIKFLETLARELADDLEDLKASQAVAAAARTTMGKVKTYVGLGFSALLLIRLGSAAISIWNRSSDKLWRRQTAKTHHADVITSALVWLMGHHVLSQADFVMLSQVVSLVLTAILSFTQIRAFVRAATALQRRFHSLLETYTCCPKPAFVQQDEASSSTAKSSTKRNPIFPVFMAGVTGCYALSCVVLVKMMLPRSFRLDFDHALGDMDVFVIHTSVINRVFAFSAAVSCFVLVVLLGIQRQNHQRHLRNGMGAAATATSVALTAGMPSGSVGTTGATTTTLRKGPVADMV